MSDAEKKRREGGFSLLELMIVVAIVVILVAVAAPAYFNHTMRSRQSIAIGELMSIKAAEERYFADNDGDYADLVTELEGFTGAGTYYVHEPYTFWVEADTSSGVWQGTAKALGDLNGDGTAYDGWEVSINELSAKPKPYVTGGDEGFTWSSLGNLF